MNNKAVILLNWNSYEDTSECISSILKNDPEWRIYVVDNASGNNEAVKLSLNFPEITVLKQQENLGFCAGNNVGIKQAIADKAEYIAVLNNDTVIPDKSLTALLEVYTQLPTSGAISPVITEYPQTDKVWFSGAKWDSKTAQFKLNPGNASIQQLKEKGVWESDFACGCCLLTTAKIFKEVGFFDERYFAYYDEADWCKRIEKAGYKSYTTSHSLINHKVSRTTPKLVSIYLLSRNRLLWMKENLPTTIRDQSNAYLQKEFWWHLANRWGFVKGEYSKDYSKALIMGIKDYRKSKFRKWSKDAEKIIFPK